MLSLVQRKFGGCNLKLPSNTLYHLIIVLGIVIFADNVVNFVLVVVVILIVMINVAIFVVAVVVS